MGKNSDILLIVKHVLNMIYGISLLLKSVYSQQARNTLLETNFYGRTLKIHCRVETKFVCLMFLMVVPEI